MTGWLDFGQRMYQPEIGRFFTVDRFADKYLDFTPYQYAANNPIKVIDNNGDSLALSGSGVDKAVAEINKSSGGYYTASADEDGKISYTKTDKEGTPTDAQQGFIDNFLTVIEMEGTVSIEVVESSEDVPIGDFKGSKMDIDDISKIGNGDAMSSAGALIHEVTEQAAKQNLGMEFEDAYRIGENSERSVTGNDSISFILRVKSDPTKPHVQSGSWDIRFKNRSSGTSSRMVAERLEIGTSIIAAALMDLIDLLEAYRLEEREKEITAQDKRKMLTEDEIKEARLYLSGPNLMERTKEDIGNAGVIGEEMNRLWLNGKGTKRKRQTFPR